MPNEEELITIVELQKLQERKKPILCLDFDGVCHSYTSGWKGADVIPDDAVPGLFEFLEQAAPYFDIQVFSTRSNLPGGTDAMKEWFIAEWHKWVRQFPNTEGHPYLLPAHCITYPTEKPPAFVSLDDRVLTFNGVFPDVEILRTFKPWNKK